MAFCDLCRFAHPSNVRVCFPGLPGVPGDFGPHGAPMGMSMAPGFTHPPHLHHGAPLHHHHPHPAAYLPSHPAPSPNYHHHHHHAMLMHGGAPGHLHPERTPLMSPVDPGSGGPSLDIHAQ
ncbi:unnamed protein product [Knipowitschia caucasica]